MVWEMLSGAFWPAFHPYLEQYLQKVVGGESSYIYMYGP